jgi:hypothetical protein
VRCRKPRHYPAVDPLWEDTHGCVKRQQWEAEVYALHDGLRAFNRLRDRIKERWPGLDDVEVKWWAHYVIDNHQEFSQDKTADQIRGLLIASIGKQWAP